MVIEGKRGGEGEMEGRESIPQAYDTPGLRHPARSCVPRRSIPMRISNLATKSK